MFSDFGGVAKAGLLMSIAASILPAAQIHFTQTSGYTYIDAVAVPFDTGQVAGPTAGSVGPTVVGTQSAYSFGSADFGMLRGFSTATSVNAFLLPQTQLNAQWQDTIHVTSPGLSDGTPTNIVFSMHLSDSLSSVPFVGGYTGSNAWANLDGIGANASLSIHDTFGTPPLFFTVSTVYSTTVGADVLIGGALQTNSGPQNSLATADASNTGLFAMSFLTPGVSYTSASGTIYATSFQSAAPEPGTLLLAGLALVFAIVRSGAGKASRQMARR